MDFYKKNAKPLDELIKNSLFRYVPDDLAEKAKKTKKVFDNIEVLKDDDKEKVDLIRTSDSVVRNLKHQYEHDAKSAAEKKQKEIDDRHRREADAFDRSQRSRNDDYDNYNDKNTGHSHFGNGDAYRA